MLAELEPAARLVRRVVRECVARWLEPDAIAEYCEFATAGSLLARFESGHKFWIAMLNGAVTGVMEIKGAAHVLMLFIAPEYQRRGIARALLTAAFPGFPAKCALPLTVNSVPQSVPAYERLGFVQDGAEQNVRGIRFVPMKLQASVAR